MCPSCGLDLYSMCRISGALYNTVQLPVKLERNIHCIPDLLLPIQRNAKAYKNGVEEQGITRFSKLTSTVESVTINSRNRFSCGDRACYLCYISSLAGG